MAAEPLGRLFFTPEQRALLAATRDGGGESTRFTANGAVVRSGGGATVWINGRPRHESNAERTIHADKRGDIAVNVGEAAPVALRIGETLDRGTGKVSGGVAPGALRVGPPAKDGDEARP